MTDSTPSNFSSPGSSPSRPTSRPPTSHPTSHPGNKSRKFAGGVKRGFGAAPGGPRAGGPGPGGPAYKPGKFRVEDRARDAAFVRLTQQAEKYPEFDLRGPETSGFSSRDANFAHAIYDAAMARWLTLRHLLQSKLSKPFDTLEAPLKGVLLGGAAQILFLDRVPSHAAINTAVQWAKTNIRPGAGGLVNAVLRKIAILKGEDGDDAQQAEATEATLSPPTVSRDEALQRLRSALARRDALIMTDGSVRTLTEPSLPEDPFERLSVQTSCPGPLLERWRDQFGENATIELALHVLANAPVTLFSARAGLSRTPGETIAVGNPKARVLLLPHDSKSHHIVTDGVDHLAEFLKEHRDLWVQDAASSCVVESLPDDANIQCVVDLCAGLGTKSRQLLAKYPKATIYACDVDARRLGVLREEFPAESYPRLRIFDARELPPELTGKADLVLLDVPCSNTAVAGRRVEVRYRALPPLLKRITEQQRDIAKKGLSLLKPGGVLAYSTCSLEREENEAQAQWLASLSTPTLKLIRESRTTPRGVPGEGPHAYQDGSYHAILQVQA